MRIPVCIGMPRSASRMTWQIAKLLVPPEPPWWQSTAAMNYVLPSTFSAADREWPWPWRTHLYEKGVDPVIYTYRHPVEAYFSYLSRAGKAKEATTLDGILQHKEIVEQLQRDESTGRSVLWLRYEDYYRNERKKVQDIAGFLGAEDMPIDQIAEDVSIEKNLERAYSMGEGKTFTNHIDPQHGLQPGHVNKQTMGEPGTYLRAYSKHMDTFYSKAGFRSLLELADKLGY